MPDTRRKSGRLSAAKEIKYFVDAEESDHEVEEALPTEVREPAENVIEVETPPPTLSLETFTTKSKLQSGLCIVRKLNNGKFELLNLSEADINQLSSEESGKMIRDNAGLLSLLETTVKGWDNLKVKSSQALASATGGIFRIQKLPIELRYRIYDFAIISPHNLRYVKDIGHRILGFGLRETCKAIYEETEKHFWRNTFKLCLGDRNFRAMQELILAKVQRLSFTWIGMKRRCPDYFVTLRQKCPKLKVLNIELSCGVLDQASYSRYNTRQRLYEDEDIARRFRWANGFDALVSIRGIERVNVTRHRNCDNDEFSKQEMDAFVSWLNSIVTKPRPDPKTTSLKATSNTNAGHRVPKDGAKKRKQRNFDGDGDDGEWRGGKRSTGHKKARATKLPIFIHHSWSSDDSW